MKSFGFATVSLLLAAGACLAQVPATNANSFDLDNGYETLGIFVTATTPTPGNEVAGDGIVNASTANHMIYEIIPRELLHSSNGTAPGTMELVSLEVGLAHSWMGIMTGGTPPVVWDMSFHPVTYLNPSSGAGPDGRRYPNLAAPLLLTIVGGPIALPIPSSCTGSSYATYLLAFELGNATPGSGITLPADGATDIAWCFWQPSGMSTLPGDTSGCEIGGNLSLMSLLSTNERVPNGITTGAATPAPSGVNRNPFHGWRFGPTNFNNAPSTQGFRAWPGFREPTLQFRFFSTTTVPTAMTIPERGSGSLFMDATLPVTLNPGARTCASGHAGELVIHFATANLLFYPLYAQPGIPVTFTSNVMLNLADPAFFALTPVLDVVLAANTTDYHFAVKHTADTPLGLGLAGPIAPPGFKFALQAFIVNLAAGPPFTVVSTNVALGNVY